MLSMSHLLALALGGVGGFYSTKVFALVKAWMSKVPPTK